MKLSTRLLWATLLTCCALLPSTIQANDSAFEGVAGAPRPLKGEHSAIRMASEKVVLTAAEKSFTTQADFVFKNDSSRKVTVTMGFPEGTFGDPASGGPVAKSSFLSFATFVDGQKVTARRTTLKEVDAGGFDVYWLKTVTFQPRQTRNIRVLARSPYGGSVLWRQQNALAYEFTGQNWKGNVSRSDLEVRVPLAGLWTVNMIAGLKSPAYNLSVTPTQAVLRRSWVNWPAKESVSIGLMRATPFWLADADRFQNNTIDRQLFQNTKTFRIGKNNGQLGRYDVIAPDGFVRNGTTYVSISRLAYRLNQMDYLKAPNSNVETFYDTHKRAYGLKAGSLSLYFRANSRQMERHENGAVRSMTMSATPLQLTGDNDFTFYVPLKAAAQALNIKATANQTTRLMTLTR